jgi:GMC oxidoreductase
MPDGRFIGLDAFQWIAMLAARLTVLLLVDAWAGHYRRVFIRRAQYAPSLSGGLLVAFAIAAVISPRTGWIEAASRVAGWLATAAGLAGFCLHRYYGIIRKPGGYKLLLNYLMYGAPPLAPLGLSAMGVFALISAKGLAGGADIAREILRAARGEDIWDVNRTAHLMGTCRMGGDANASVVDVDGRAHDVPNLFICGGSVFPTSGAVNPSLTIQADRRADGGSHPSLGREKRALIANGFPNWPCEWSGGAPFPAFRKKAGLRVFAAR